MAEHKNILNRLYLVVVFLLIFVIAVGFKLFHIQVNGEKYKQLAQKRIYDDFTIPANRGNIYGANGNLLATSVPNYDIRFDAVTVSEEDFNKYIGPLSDSLAKMLGKSPGYYEHRMRRARQNGNRYLLIARNLGYLDYVKIKNFPLFKKGPYQGGFITEQEIVRELPLGKMAARTIGGGKAGLEGAFNEYLEGKDGHQLKQKIADGLWKPVSGAKEVPPQNGMDVVSTIDMNMQDIVHHALLEQLKEFKADHGTAIVMEVETGAIKAVANLGRTDEGTYYEKRNYAVWESQEPGSTFKLMAIVAALEDNVVDTADVFDSEDGSVRYYNRVVYDSHWGGYGKISAARAFEVSSNTVFSKIVALGYKDNPEAFVNRLYYMGLGEEIGLEILGEGNPDIPRPGDPDWYGTTLPWMAFGYGVSLTPLQTLTFYNAIANDGIRVKPRFVKAIRDGNRIVKTFDKTVMDHSMCSEETAKIAQDLLRNVVKHGTAHGIALEDLALAGKTGTAKVNYGNSAAGELGYTASFAGFFPANDPKYSCIVVVNHPDMSIGFYGSQVAAPVFQEIAKKIYNDTPRRDTLKTIQIENQHIQKAYQSYYALAQKENNIMPDVEGLPAMDAVALLENMGLKVKLQGTGIVTSQSIAAGQSIINKNAISITTR